MPVDPARSRGSTDRDQTSVEAHFCELESLDLIEGERTERGDVRWTARVCGVYFEVPKTRKANAGRESSAT
jgi:hypothetical protein